MLYQKCLSPKWSINLYSIKSKLGEFVPEQLREWDSVGYIWVTVWKRSIIISNLLFLLFLADKAFFQKFGWFASIIVTVTRGIRCFKNFGLNLKTKMLQNAQCNLSYSKFTLISNWFYCASCVRSSHCFKEQSKGLQPEDRKNKVKTHYYLVL